MAGRPAGAAVPTPKPGGPRPPRIIIPGQRGFRTQAFHGYSVEWSPYFPGRLAVGSAQHYGIAGNGRLSILRDGMNPGEAITPERSFDTQEGIYEVAWAENTENLVVCATGDGSLVLFDCSNPSPQPLRIYKEHTRDAYAVDWNLVAKNSFVSGSWDQTVKLWDPHRPQSLATFQGHDHVVYAVEWHPHQPNMFGSCSADRTLRIWDAGAAGKPATVLPVHDYEVLTFDWCKYDGNLVVTGSVDKSVRVWDIRRPLNPLFIFPGHQFAVRKVKFSPHDKNRILSCSYDMTVRLWNMGAPNGQAQEGVYDHHTEFVVGIDFDLHRRGVVADCSFDETVQIYSPPPLTGP
eukprot:Clim_evm51s153 gene=Clim_evmTU51s153